MPSSKITTLSILMRVNSSLNLPRCAKLLAIYCFAIMAHSLTAREQKPQAVRFLFSQGFRSCKILYRDPPNKFFEIVGAVNTRRNSDAALHARAYQFCFDGGIYEHPRDSTERLFMQSADEPDSWNEAVEYDVANSGWLLREQLENEADELAKKGYAMPLQVYIAGHSHGGWLVERLTGFLGSTSKIKVHRLLTIDPISYVLCPSATFALNLMKNFTIFGFLSDDECLRAPQDLINFHPAVAKITEGNWTNIYQTDGLFLRSSAIPSATYNLQRPWKDTVDALKSHSYILYDERVWQGFWGAMQREL